MDSAFAEVQIDGVAHGGYCVSRLPQGKVVMVRGALPAEQVRIQVTSQRSKVAYGRVVEVLDASPDRVEHIWPEGNTLDLGGVELGHVAPGAQLRWKRAVLRQALRRNGRGRYPGRGGCCGCGGQRPAYPLELYGLSRGRPGDVRGRF